MEVKPQLLFSKVGHKRHAPKVNSFIWARKILNKNNINNVKEVILITLPRVLGYVFNPVSFYFCYDKNENLKAVICEVNNTFKETHIYLCKPEKGDSIEDNDWLESKKMFHVSPFFKREGYYQFRFSSKKENLGIWINYFDNDNTKLLSTSVVGQFVEASKSNLRKAFWNYPLITFKTIFLIHWQAVKIISKKIRYIPKPKQLKDNITQTK